MPTEPKTLLEAVRHFSDLNVCHAYMVAQKFPAAAKRMRPKKRKKKERN